MTVMQHVNKGPEVLTAILVENEDADKQKPGAGDRKVELCYTNYRNDYRTSVVLVNGRKVDIRGWKLGVFNEPRNEGMPGYEDGIKRLGPELKKQIPQHWYDVIGNLLDAPQEAQGIESKV